MSVRSVYWHFGARRAFLRSHLLKTKGKRPMCSTMALRSPPDFHIMGIFFRAPSKTLSRATRRCGGAMLVANGGGIVMVYQSKILLKKNLVLRQKAISKNMVLRNLTKRRG